MLSSVLSLTGRRTFYHCVATWHKSLAHRVILPNTYGIRKHILILDEVLNLINLGLYIVLVLSILLLCDNIIFILNDTSNDTFLQINLGYFIPQIPRNVWHQVFGLKQDKIYC